jgi:hypothetical protein
MFITDDHGIVFDTGEFYEINSSFTDMYYCAGGTFRDGHYIPEDIDIGFDYGSSLRVL